MNAKSTFLFICFLYTICPSFLLFISSLKKFASFCIKMLIYVGNFSLFVQLKNDNNLIKFHFFFAFVIKNCTHFRDVWVCVWGVLVD